MEERSQPAKPAIRNPGTNLKGFITKCVESIKEPSDVILFSNPPEGPEMGKKAAIKFIICHLSGEEARAIGAVVIGEISVNIEDLERCYPSGPPSFRFITPSGVFKTNEQPCISGGVYHSTEFTPQPISGYIANLMNVFGNPKSLGGGIAINANIGASEQRAYSRATEEFNRSTREMLELNRTIYEDYYRQSRTWDEKPAVAAPRGRLGARAAAMREAQPSKLTSCMRYIHYFNIDHTKEDFVSDLTGIISCYPGWMPYNEFYMRMKLDGAKIDLPEPDLNAYAKIVEEIRLKNEATYNRGMYGTTATPEYNLWSHILMKAIDLRHQYDCWISLSPEHRTTSNWCEFRLANRELADKLLMEHIIKTECGSKDDGNGDGKDDTDLTVSKLSKHYAKWNDYKKRNPDKAAIIRTFANYLAKKSVIDHHTVEVKLPTERPARRQQPWVPDDDASDDE